MNIVYGVFNTLEVTNEDTKKVSFNCELFQDHQSEFTTSI